MRFDRRERREERVRRGRHREVALARHAGALAVAQLHAHRARVAAEFPGARGQALRERGRVAPVDRDDRPRPAQPPLDRRQRRAFEPDHQDGRSIGRPSASQCKKPPARKPTFTPASRSVSAASFASSVERP